MPQLCGHTVLVARVVIRALRKRCFADGQAMLKYQAPYFYRISQRVPENLLAKYGGDILQEVLEWGLKWATCSNRWHE